MRLTSAGNAVISIHSLRMEGDVADGRALHTLDISIHSLRMEGDLNSRTHRRQRKHFNPLPPHGGRLEIAFKRWFDDEFQSTPSAWRETFSPTNNLTDAIYFNPLPPHGGRPESVQRALAEYEISIHSLRMEGDGEREFEKRNGVRISIHSLRMEGDSLVWYANRRKIYFNPLPPHGGRLTYNYTG